MYNEYADHRAGIRQGCSRPVHGTRQQSVQGLPMLKSQGACCAADLRVRQLTWMRQLRAKAADARISGCMLCSRSESWVTAPCSATAAAICDQHKGSACCICTAPEAAGACARHSIRPSAVLWHAGQCLDRGGDSQAPSAPTLERTVSAHMGSENDT